MLRKNTTLNRQRNTFNNHDNGFGQFVDIEEYEFDKNTLVDHKLNNKIADAYENYFPIMENKSSKSIDFSFAEEKKTTKSGYKSFFRNTITQIESAVKGALNYLTSFVNGSIFTFNSNPSKLLDKQENIIKADINEKNEETYVQIKNDIELSPIKLEIMEEGMLNPINMDKNYKSWAERTTSSVSSISR